MNRRLLLFASLWVSMALAAVAQNEVKHHDGTTEFTSRGATGTDAKTLLQRIPGDQHGTNNTLAELWMVLQDQDVLTSEVFSVEVRGNDPAGPATGQPDMSAAGLIASFGPFDVTFPGLSGASAALVTFTGLGVTLPDGPSVPAGDFYVGIATPPEPLWTADGISCHISAALSGLAGEQMNPGAIGYTGAAGIAGLGWDCNTTTGAIALGAGNRAWNIGSRLVEGVVQPFADNPAAFTGAGGAGLNPNFGYAGIFPWMARPGTADGIGVRVRVTRPVGTPVMLVIGASAFPIGIDVFATGPGLCVAPPFILSPPVLTGPPVDVSMPVTTSEAVFGPVPGSPAFAGATIFIQGLAGLGGPSPELTSLCKIQL